MSADEYAGNMSAALKMSRTEMGLLIPDHVTTMDPNQAGIALDDYTNAFVGVESGERNAEEPVELKRMDKTAREPLEDVVDRAAKILGYGLGVLERFMQACREIDIMPFDPETVDKYKYHEKTKKYHHPSGYPHFLRWVAVSIKKFKKPVPEFALQTALDIKERCPEIEFEIEELTPTPCPFLVAVLPDGSRYHLEVWNEPDFKKPRTV